MQPTLRDWDRIVVNSSAGKDSQAMLDYLVELADKEGVRDRLLVLHCDLGEEEWPGTKELAAEHAAHYGLRFEIRKRSKRSLLDEILHRRRWPSSKQRYCTSYYKREPGLLLMTQLGREGARKVLNCYGFRTEESPARRKKPQFERHTRACTRHREVWTWLPIHEWTERQVWDRIAQAGTRTHHAYAIGMKRLSCRFCIFAPKAALMLSAQANPELFAKYLAAEKTIGHSFRQELALADVQAALEKGEKISHQDGAWNM
jgi:3'-phosphoadenosine 5'-phosphosulfate sulfotransferase (PAPS reductase)/FAD synthetase